MQCRIVLMGHRLTSNNKINQSESTSTGFKMILNYKIVARQQNCIKSIQNVRPSLILHTFYVYYISY